MRSYLSTLSFKVLHWVRKDQVFQTLPTEDVIDRQRFVVFRLFSFTAVLVCVAVATKMLVTLKSNWLPYSVLATGGFLMVNYLRLKPGDSLRRAYVSMLIACLVLLHLVAYTCGGIRTGGTFFLTAVIIYAFMLLGRNGGWWITAAAGLHIGILFYFSSFTNLTSFSLFEENIKLINEDFLVNILLTFLLISALSSYLQSGRNVVIQRIVETNQMLAEQNRLLESQNAALEKKNEELDKFASVAAHDLRSPLRAMASLADMVLEDDLQMSEESKHKLDLIRQRSHRMDKLLSALQDYARAGSRPESKGWVNLDALVLGLKVKHQHSAAVQIQSTVPQQEILTYPGLLEKVLDLLLDNAIRFNDKTLKLVSIEATLEGKFMQFSVRDNGPGIPKEFHQKVFVIFQTLSARDQVDTSGAGLAIARKIVQEQGGQMHLYSESEVQGCEFRFSWPFDESQKEASAQRA